MTDPQTPESQDRPADAAPETAAPPGEQVDSFAAEPPAEPPPEPSAELAGQQPVAGPPHVQPPHVEPEDTPTLVDEEPAAPVTGAEEPPAQEAPAEAPARPARSRGWLPLAALGAAVALLAAGTGYLAWQLREQSLAEDARGEATAAARDAARLLFSYDHETLDEDFEKGLAVTTGAFRDEYRRTTQQVVTPVARDYKAVVVAEVVESAVVEAGARRVTALVFLNQATTSTRVEGQQVDQNRVRMQLVRHDGRWLVEGVSAL